MAKLEVITGPMFSGKSKELTRRLEVIEIAGTRVLVVKHRLDDARVKNSIGARFKKSGGGSAELIGTHQSYSIETAAELTSLLEESRPPILAIDEIHFFGSWIVDYISALLAEHARDEFMIIAVGLNTDYRRQPFGPTPQLMSLADDVTILRAVCDKCKQLPENAVFTQRAYDSSGEQIEVGDKGLYEARCRRCHTIPDIVD